MRIVIEHDQLHKNSRLFDMIFDNAQIIETFDCGLVSLADLLCLEFLTEEDIQNREEELNLMDYKIFKIYEEVSPKNYIYIIHGFPGDQSCYWVFDENYQLIGQSDNNLYNIEEKINDDIIQLYKNFTQWYNLTTKNMCQFDLDLFYSHSDGIYEVHV